MRKFSFPSREGPRVRLRPCVPTDYAYLFSLGSSPENCIRWRHRGTTPSFEAFVQLLFEETLAMFVVELRGTARPIGMVQVYRANYRNGTVNGAVLCEHSDEALGVPAEAFALLCHYVFSVFPIRNIHLEIVEFNYERITSGAGRLFEVEGCLKENEYYGGRYWDTYFLTIKREPAMPVLEALFGAQALVDVPGS